MQRSVAEDMALYIARQEESTVRRIGGTLEMLIADTESRIRSTLGNAEDNANDFGPDLAWSLQRAWQYPINAPQTVSSLYQIALAIMSVCEGIWAIPLLRPKPSDPKAEFDSILNMAKHLLIDTKHLYANFKSKYPYEGEHKLESLPVLSINAVELSTIQVPAGLTKLSSELFIYQKHFDWLKKAAHVVRPLDHEFTSIHNRIDKLVKKVDFLMTKLNIARVSDTPLPQLPNSTTQWGVVQTGHAIFHHFHLFLDYATRVLVLMRNKL
ncbi:interleukin-11 [Pseudophryne corroboree]|uniref:interleukin-11 n=1 Tax=Pseudophryne corroboree TaxID=495146 RepID=UPI003081AEC8